MRRKYDCSLPQCITIPREASIPPLPPPLTITSLIDYVNL